MKQPESNIAANREQQQDEPGDRDGADGKPRTLTAVDTGGEAGEYNGGLNRTDRDQQRDEARKYAWGGMHGER